MTMEKIYSKEMDVAYYLTNHKSQLKAANMLRIFTDVSFYQGDLVDHRLEADFDFFWVLYRWHVKIHRFPKTHERINVSTWARNFKKFYAYRGFDMVDSQGQVLVEAETTWFKLNKDTGRLARFPENIDQEYGNSEKGMAAGKKILRQVERVDLEKDLEVENNDLDLNRHVNNAVYMDWILNSLDMDFLEKHDLSLMDIIYKKELTLGQKVKLVMELNYLDDRVELLANIKEGKDIFTYIYLVFK